MISKILIYMMMFSDYMAGFLSISDWALVILLILSCLHGRIKFEKDNRLFFPLLLIVTGSVLSFILNFDKSYFSIPDFAKTSIKLILYISSVLVIPQYIYRKNKDIFKLVKVFLAAAVAGGVLQYLIVWIFGRKSWPLYSLGGNFFGLTTENTMFNNAGMMRTRSFWSEPAHYAIFISLLFILLLYNEKRKLSKLWFAIYIIGIVSANSVSGYGIMVAVFVFYNADIKKFVSRPGNLIICIVGMAFVALVVLSNDYLLGRLKNLLEMKDHSGIVRTFGGFHILPYVPWQGVGIGNHVNFYHSLNLNDLLWFSGSGEFYNNILVAVITMGYIGAIGFLLFEFGILKDNKKIFVALLVTHFGWGKLFTTPIWVFLILYLCMKKQTDVGGFIND